MNQVNVFAFTPMGNQEAPDVTIRINGDIAQAAGKDDPLTAWSDAFDAQAEAIFVALRDSLPGGTIDRLAGKLLAYKASHFHVKG